MIEDASRAPSPSPEDREWFAGWLEGMRVGLAESHRGVSIHDPMNEAFELVSGKGPDFLKGYEHGVTTGRSAKDTLGQLTRSVAPPRLRPPARSSAAATATPRWRNVAAAFVIGAGLASGAWFVGGHGAGAETAAPADLPAACVSEANTLMAAGAAPTLWNGLPPGVQNVLVALDSAYISVLGVSGPAILRQTLATQLAGGAPSQQRFVIVWIGDRGYGVAADLLVLSLPSPDVEVRRIAASTLANQPTPLVTAAAHGATIIRAHLTETDPLIRTDLQTLRTRLGI